MINGFVAYGSSANPIKVHFKKHYCNKCGARLKVVKDRTCISRTSPEAKYYYHLVYDDDGIGDYEFVHKIFCCPRCAHEIELITQLSLEDCDAVAGKLGKYCFKKGIKVTKIKEYFETRDGRTVEKAENIENISSFRLQAFNEDDCILDYKAPIRREKRESRPYYFDISWSDVKSSLKKIK